MEKLEKNMIGTVPKVRFLQYLRIVPEMLVYEAVSKIALLGIVFLLKKLMIWAIYMSGHVAVTSGDFLFIFQSPFGWLVIVTTLILLGVYAAFDINVIVNYAGEKVAGRPTVLWKIIFESLEEALRFFTPGGLVVLLFATLITPVVGIGTSISLTSNLRVPNFVSSVIDSTPLYSVLYNVFIVLMALTIFFGIFTIPGMIIDHVAPLRSFCLSAKLVIKHWWKILKHLFIFNLKFLGLAVAFLFTGTLMSFILVIFNWQREDPSLLRFGAVSFVLFLFVINAALTAIYVPLVTINVVQLYQSFKDEVPEKAKESDRSVFSKMLIVVFACYIAGWGVSFWVNENFDWLFATSYSTDIISHRGGGFTGGENTVLGINNAIEHGCFGVEIDIQRTKDGYYILNHDNTFARVAGVDKAPDEMTLEEVRELELTEEPGSKVPTITEILDATHDKITLFIELKGKTADIQMCDDMVKLLRERHIEDECVLISLKYDLIDYLEDNYPDIQTGYLAFISLGNTAELKCDYIALEEQAVNSDIIDAVHETGHKMLVWTPNKYDAQRSFITSKVDGIITDDLEQAEQIKDELEKRSPFEVMIDALLAGIM